MTQHYDVVIVGGGMVGATLACALAGEGFRIAVIEGQAPGAAPADGRHDLRVSAITRASQQIFTAVGAWPAMIVQRVSPFTDMQVWDAGGSGEIHFDGAEVGTDALGHIIENRVIQSALWQVMQAQRVISVRCPAELASYHVADDAVHIELANGERLSAALLVGADGARSRVREIADIETQGWSYAQQGVVATVRTELPHQATAWQRFLPTGPLAFLPLSDGQCSIVWSTSDEEAARLSALPDVEFLQELTVASGGRLGQMLDCGPRAAFPLRLMHAREYVRPRLALIGDAAHNVHPLAGQGVNLGLLDAAVLAEVLRVARAERRDIGAFNVLRRYERWRKGDNLLMLGVMDGFKRLFSNDQPLLGWLRNTGLAITDRLPPVKNEIMRRAMGLAGDLPPLACAGEDVRHAR